MNLSPEENSEDAAGSARPNRPADDGLTDSTANHTGAPATSAVGVRLTNLTVKAGGRPLLQDATAEFEPGQITLVLGCSGVGKSVLMRIIAGLIGHDEPGIEFEGSVIVGSGTTADSHPPSRPDVAVVFQNHALFDEFSPIDNVLMAIDHSRATLDDSDTSDQQRVEKAKSLLRDLGVPVDRRTSVLSGGQRQRLAIARAMSLEAPVVIYDEPTAGLDANTSKQVAALIHQTQLRHQRTSIIVTHDYQALSEIADRVIRFEQETRKLVELPRERWVELPGILGRPPVADDDSESRRREPVKILLRPLAELMERTGAGVQAAVALPLTLIPRWNSAVWGLRMTWHYLKLIAGPSAMLYLGVAGIIIGFVSTNFTFRFLPYRQYSEALIIENLLHAVGFALFRIFVPILGTSLIAARCGAAVASDIGNKVYGSQTAAMRTLRMEPARYLRTPVLLAFLIGTPLLISIAYIVATLTSIFAFLLTHGEYGIAFWDAHYHYQLRRPGEAFFRGSGWLLAKLLTCAAGIALITYREGIAPKYSGPDVSKGVTSAILWATLWVLFVHFVFSFYEFKAIG